MEGGTEAEALHYEAGQVNGGEVLTDHEQVLKDHEQRDGVYWPSVFFFYVSACALSWPFYWWRDIHPESWARWGLPGVPTSSPLTFVAKMAVVMWGPGVAAILSLIIFRGTHRRRITFRGTSAWKGVAFYIVPILIAAAVGVPLPDGSVNRLATVALGLVTLFTVLGEELGWRGFLQDALRPLPRLQRYALVGVMWEFWHFTNRTSHGSLGRVLLTLAIFYPLGIVLSWVIGEATEVGKSLLVAVTLHAWVDIVGTFPGPRTYTALALSIVFWTFMLLRWRKATKGGTCVER